MGKKYIIELLDDSESEFKGIMAFGLTQENQISVELIPEESMTPYTEPDLEQVRKEEYDKGFDDGRNKCQSREYCMNESYQQGLNDLWEAMQKAIKMYCEIDNEVFLRVFHDVKCDWGESVLQALFKNTPQHLIDSIRQYEQKQEEQIQVGDEVAFHNDDRYYTVVVVTYIGDDGYVDVMDGKGTLYAHKNPKRCTKTGRNFPEIASVLEKMREGQEE